MTCNTRAVIPAKAGIQSVDLREASEFMILRINLRAGFQPSLE
jgi:hypothetical protein